MIFIFPQAPLWAYLLCAVGLFVYQSLDAIDGKQARRTNSSSPLGELFDHGCDSLSTGMLWLHVAHCCCSCINSIHVQYFGRLEASDGGHNDFFSPLFQCLWSWAPALLCSWARTQTGCSSVASRACLCFTVPTGKPMSLVPCALACECEHWGPQGIHVG